MWEERELRYSDHLPPHFNDLSLSETERKHLSSFKCISNHKAKFIAFFNRPRETLEKIFKV